MSHSDVLMDLQFEGVPINTFFGSQELSLIAIDGVLQKR